VNIVCNHLDAAATLLLEQHILRLHVAVYNLVLVERIQAEQQRVRELAHELQTEALEVVLLDELVQIDAEQFEGDAHVAAEGERVEHVDDVHGVVLVLLAQLTQDAYLLVRLTVEALLVAHHLERHVLVRLMIVGLDHLAERALTDHAQHLVAIRHVVVRHMNVRALFVVVLVVVGPADDARPFLRVRADEVDLLVVEDLVMLVRGQLVHVQLHHHLRRDGRRLRFDADDAVAAATAVSSTLAAAPGAPAPATAIGVAIGTSVSHHRAARLAVGLRVRVVTGVVAHGPVIQALAFPR